MSIVHVPGGILSRGERHREAELRPLLGEDEAYLAEKAPGLPPARKATLLLTRCLERLGPYERPTPELVRGLTVGDREALLLHVRRLTFGDRLPCLLRCPACAEPMDLDLRVGDLLLDPYAAWEESWTAPIPGDAPDAPPRMLRFRLPTGGDQEAVEPLARRDPAAASGLLLRRCLVDPDAAIPGPEGVLAVSARMAELDAQAEMLLSLTCPHCAHPFTALLDAAGYLFRELTQGARQLDREVHLLAFHYHWSPRDILGLTPRKRRVYLELLEDALSEVRA